MQASAPAAVPLTEVSLGVGTQLRKAFGRKVFRGEVVAHHLPEDGKKDQAEELFEVLYEDSDREDLTRAELVALLTNPPVETKKRGRNASTATGQAGTSPSRMRLRRAEKLAPLPTALKRIFFETHSKEAPGLSCRGRNVRLLHSNPNVFEIQDFLTESEWRHLDAIVTQQDRLPRGKGFEQSFTDKAASPSSPESRNSSALASVVSDERTSTFFHLRKFGDAKVRAIEARAAELMGLPAGQVEPLQVVSYRDGQHFRPHHDAGTLESDDDDDEEGGGQEEGKDGGVASASNINNSSGSGNGATPAHEDAATSKKTTGEEEEEASKKYKVALVAPRRLVTFFVYLNTLPPGVGATHFPALGLHVQPKARSALVFCNVQPNGHPDPATVHEAQPVGEGYRKFGLNLWISDTSCLEYASATGPHAGVTYSKTHSLSSPSSSTGRNKNGNALKASSRRKSGGGGGTPLVECDTSPASASSSVSSSSSSSSGCTTGWESGLDGGVGLSSGGVLSALEHFETARREEAVALLGNTEDSSTFSALFGLHATTTTTSNDSSRLVELPTAGESLLIAGGPAAMAAELMGVPLPTSPPTFFEAVVADQWDYNNEGLAIDPAAAAAKSGAQAEDNGSCGDGYSSNGGSSELSKGGGSNSSVGSGGSSSGMVLVPTVEQAPEPLPPEVESLGHVGAMVAASAAAMLM